MTPLFCLQPVPLRVRPAPFEPAYGLLGRLAVRHGYVTTRLFVADMGFGIADFVHELECGRRLAELARLTRCAKAAIAASTLVTDQTGTLRIGAVRISVTANHRAVSGAGRVCPDCLRADLETRDGPAACRPHRRVWWDLTGVMSCPLHGVLLVNVCPDCGSRPSRAPASPRYCRCGHDFAGLTTRPLEVSDRVADHYLVGRLGGVATMIHPLFDRMPVHEAALSMLRIGRANLLGSRGLSFKNDTTEPALWAKMASIGFQEAVTHKR
ncbi:TniQ family protein [Azospirillum doebereinerae]